MGQVKRMVLELEEQEEAGRLEFDRAEEDLARWVLSGAPFPIPFDPASVCVPCLAWELFTPALIQPVIADNGDWLEVTSRSTQAIIQALFPPFNCAGMTEEDIFKAVGVELFDAGYRPSGPNSNPIWTFPA